jgi:hypothetical protein
MSTETETPETPEEEAEGTTHTIPLAADFNSALEWAMGSRRGGLLKAAPLPDRRKLTNKDLESLRDLLAGLIDALGARERRLMACSCDLDAATELLEDIRTAPFGEVLTRCTQAHEIVSETAAELRRSDFPEDDESN